MNPNECDNPCLVHDFKNRKQYYVPCWKCTKCLEKRKKQFYYQFANYIKKQDETDTNIVERNVAGDKESL